MADNKEDGNWKKITATTKAKVTLPKKCVGNSILWRREEKKGEKSFVIRTRKKQEEIITTLQEKPFTQDFRCAAGSGASDPKRPEKRTLPTDSSFLERGKK